MRTFILSIIVLLTVSALAITNAVIFCNKSAELITALESLPEKYNEQEIDQIIDLWLKNESFFNLTVNHNVTDKIEEALYHLKVAGDNSTVDIILIMLDDMKRSSLLSIDRIM